MNQTSPPQGSIEAPNAAFPTAQPPPYDPYSGFGWILQLGKIPAIVFGMSMLLFLPFALEASPTFVLGWLAAGAGGAGLYLGIRRGELRGRFRFRPLRSAWRWVPAALIANLLCEGAFLLIWRRWAGPSPSNSDLLEPYMSAPAGWAALVVLLVGIVPLLEEMGWRGVLQRHLERRIGALPAILLSALTFGVFHFHAWGLPLFIISGLLLGCSAYWTDSIWPGVVLHGGWNAAMILLEAAKLQKDPLPAVSTAMLCGVFLASLFSLLWIFRKMGTLARTAG